MPDRVRFGTRNDTENPEKSSGFNGFPFPIKEYDTWLAATEAGLFRYEYPAAIPFPTLIKWFHRVKAWGGDASGQILHSAIPGGQADVTSIYSTTNEQVLNGASSEMDLLDTELPDSYARNFINTQLGVSIDPIPDDTSASIYFYVSIFGFSGVNDLDERPPIVRVDELYYPLISIQFQASDFGYEDENEAIVYVGIHDLYTHHEGTAVIELDGVEIPATIDGDWSPTASVFPVEYWPYAALDGSPIYNTTTGARLQSPRN